MKLLLIFHVLNILFTMCVFFIPYYFLQSKSLRKMINDLRYTNADLKVSPYAWLSIKAIP